jgi:hypothetical protein
MRLQHGVRREVGGMHPTVCSRLSCFPRPRPTASTPKFESKTGPEEVKIALGIGNDAVGCLIQGRSGLGVRLIHYQVPN